MLYHFSPEEISQLSGANTFFLLNFKASPSVIFTDHPNTFFGVSRLHLYFYIQRIALFFSFSAFDQLSQPSGTIKEPISQFRKPLWQSLAKADPEILYQLQNLP